MRLRRGIGVYQARNRNSPEPKPLASAEPKRCQMYPTPCCALITSYTSLTRPWSRQPSRHPASSTRRASKYRASPCNDGIMDDQHSRQASNGRRSPRIVDPEVLDIGPAKVGDVFANLAGLGFEPVESALAVSLKCSSNRNRIP